MRPHELALLMGGNTRTKSGSDLGRGMVDLFHPYYQSHIDDVPVSPVCPVSPGGTKTILIGPDEPSDVPNKLFAIYTKNDRLIVNDRAHKDKSKQSKKFNIETLGFTKLRTSYEKVENLDRQRIFHALYDHVKESGAMIYVNRDVSGHSKKVYIIQAPLRGISTKELLTDFNIPLTSSNEIAYAEVLMDEFNNLFDNCHGLVIRPSQSIL